MAALLRNCLMSPIWVLQIFTQAKDFRKNPLIGSVTLNRMGLHVSRVVLSCGVAWFRRMLLAPFVPKDVKDHFRKNGYVAIENFLTDEEFRKVKQEISHMDDDIWEMTQGNTLTQMVPMSPDMRQKMPACATFLNSSRFIRIFSYVSSNFGHPVSFIHSIKNGFQATDKADPQKTLHVDTFQPTAKFWLFLDDVPSGSGPFVYVPGSHRLSRRRLKWEYETSCQHVDDMTGHSKTGSFRLSEEEVRAQGLEPKELAVKANTLVIADTHGFHRRGDVDRPCSRHAIFGSSRVLPFNPLPGFGSRLLLDVQYFFLLKQWKSREEQAQKTGRRAIYMRRPAEHFHANQIVE